MSKVVAIEIKYEVEVKMLLYYLFFAVVDTAAYLSNKYPTCIKIVICTTINHLKTNKYNSSYSTHKVEDYNLKF